MPYSSLIVILTKMRCRRCKTFTPNKNKKNENNGNTDIQSTLILCGNEESVKKVQKRKTKGWRLSNTMPCTKAMQINWISITILLNKVTVCCVPR